MMGQSIKQAATPPIEYTLIRSKRKTLSIQIKDGELIARAPMKLAKREIDRFIESKRGWIEDKLTISKERTARRNAHEMTYGSLILYRGTDYPIIARYGGRAGFDHEVGCFFIPPNLAPEEIKSTCIQIYKMLAKDYIPKRAMEIAKDMGLTPSSIKITSAHKRLGSCNNRGSINLSWRLIQLPDDLIDYIAAHEAAHLKYLDHSNLFWGVVAEYMPDHKKRRARLKELQRRLYAEGW